MLYGKSKGGFVTTSDARISLEKLEKLYGKYNRREYVHPDPLEFVLRFTDPADQEVAGIISATLAFGRVGHILKSLEGIFQVLKKPAVDVDEMSDKELKAAFGFFRHRWTTGEELADLLVGVKRLRHEHGSLGNCFKEVLEPGDTDVIPSLTRFVAALRHVSGRKRSSLLSCPTGGSACKRLLLFLRWMIRRDDVDPGPWEGLSPSILIVPMDTHMYNIASCMGLTNRKQSDLKSALEVTSYFRKLRPDDPVRYDFSLTRPGIWGKSPTLPGEKGL